MDTKSFLHNLCLPGADRKGIILSETQRQGLKARVLGLSQKEHILIDPPLKSRPGARPVILVAHYDRVKGAPGANDNGASVANLLLLLERVKTLGERALWPEIRVIFTDGEELSEGMRPDEQGAFELGKFLKKTRLAGAFYLVLDMTGIGDTVVLGRSVQPLVERNGTQLDPMIKNYLAANRLIAKKVLAGIHEGFLLEAHTPFSDDLGLLMAGITSCQISLLPRKQAELYKREPEPNLPNAWRTMHTPEDKPDNLWPQSFAVVQDLLDQFLAYPIPKL